MVLIFALWLVVGIAIWRGHHRLGMVGAIAAMVATLVMLKVHATDVIGFCL